MIVFLATTKSLDDINVPDTSIGLGQYNLPNIVDFSSAQPQLLQTVSGNGEQVQLVDVTSTVGSNSTAFANYLYQSSSSMQLSRYGALQYDASIGTTLQDSAVILFNTSGIYALPAFLNLYNTALLRAITGNANAAISMSFWGFPETVSSRYHAWLAATRPRRPVLTFALCLCSHCAQENIQTLYSSLTAIIIGIAFAFIPANFVYFAVKETAVKSKHQQLISGVRPWAYWAANFTFDLFNYLIPAALCLLAVAIYDISELIGSNTGATVLALLLYALSVIPFAALCSFLFRSPTSAQNIMLIFFIIVGAFLLILSLVLDIIPSTQHINKSLKFVYRLLPTFCFSESIANLINRSTPTFFGTPQSLFAFDVVGWDFVFMAWEAVAYTLAVLLVEHVQASPALFTFFTRSTQPVLPVGEDDEDDDVRAERTRLQSKSATDPISILGLRKVYPSHLGVGPKVAVKDLWLGVHDGECLGFLGTNGAGQTAQRGSMQQLRLSFLSPRSTLTPLLPVVPSVLRQDVDDEDADERYLPDQRRRSAVRPQHPDAAAGHQGEDRLLPAGQSGAVHRTAAAPLAVASLLCYLCLPPPAVRRSDVDADGARALVPVRAHQGREGVAAGRLRAVDDRPARAAGRHRGPAVQGLQRRQQTQAVRGHGAHRQPAHRLPGRAQHRHGPGVAPLHVSHRRTTRRCISASLQRLSLTAGSLLCLASVYRWDFISHTMRGRSVILTTHSMEEAEALCQRIAIMVGGSMRCLGNAQRLKSLYGDGYQLAVTLSPEQVSAFHDEMLRRFPACRVVESLDTLLKYEMPKLNSDGSRVSIGSVFRLMEQLKLQYGVREYAVSETDLEQIFIRHCEKDRSKHAAEPAH